jgi:adenylate cyclase
MEEVLKDPERLKLGGTQLEATVLFTDIAGFSKISESMSPQELATLLNDYFTRMGDAIMARGGMINKYIGDAIMAIWNAPLPNPQHALLACQSALEMQRIVKSMELWKMRIGVNTGQMVAGNLGHQERMEYTVIGDNVNLASRLEGANKAFGTNILISETTEAQVRNDLLLRPVDRIRVVGKERPVRVYEVVGLPDQLEDSDFSSKLSSFTNILECYESRDWERGYRVTQDHLTRFSDDSVAQTYLSRFQRFQENPPPDDWDGTYSLESK